MTTVNEVLQFLLRLAPAEMKEDWDHIGLQCGHGDHTVHRILVALDPFLDVVEEAEACGAELIVTHHPLLFFPTHTVNDSNAVGRTLLRAIEQDKAIISMHTNLDSAPGGVNDCLAARLGLQNCTVLAPAGTDAQGRPYGLGRVGTVAETTLEDFAQHVKKALGCTGLRYASAGKLVRKVAVGGGACGEFTKAAAALGCDTFVTGDLKYNGFWDGVDLGVNLIDAGHFPTENPVCDYLLEQLQVQFPTVQVEKSKQHFDIIQYL